MTTPGIDRTSPMLQSSLQEPPLRNASMVGVAVFSHSGEFAPQVSDWSLASRGLSFAFVRTFRCGRRGELGPLGRGWTFTLAKRLVRDNSDILYHDGLGRIQRFVGTPDGRSYTPPDGAYATLSIEDSAVVLGQRYGITLSFEDPALDGRLLRIEDRNQNALQLTHTSDASYVTDSFGRRITIAYDRDGRVSQVRDHADRVWEYQYDAEGCLTNVILPPADGSAPGPHIVYEYDGAYRLTSVTDPKGQTFLRNVYDDLDRVVEQRHGTGSFAFAYVPIDSTTPDSPYHTQVTQKNGARVDLDHDRAGHAVQRTLYVRSDSLSPEDRGPEGTTPLTTTSTFNQDGELVGQTYPAGNATTWAYDSSAGDPRDRGNLLQVSNIPAPQGGSDQALISTQYAYEPAFQQLTAMVDPRGNAVTYDHDARGNLTEIHYPPVTVLNVDKLRSKQVRSLVELYAYNVAGQLLEAIDARGALTTYDYCPDTDPTGAEVGRGGGQRDPMQAGGYLARVTRDPAGTTHTLPGKPANLVTDFGYDVYGNITNIWDGKGQETRREYDRLGRLTSVTPRGMSIPQVTIRYDANGNPADIATTFDRYQFDPASGSVVPKSTTVLQRLAYTALNNLAFRTITADGQSLTESFVRNENEDIVTRVQPLGNATEYLFDERGLLLEQRLGASSSSPPMTMMRYTYTLNGQLSSITDGNNAQTRYQYDGQQRYCGVTNADGTKEGRTLDLFGNVVQVEVSGDTGGGDQAVLLGESREYDELNRVVRVDRAWRDLTGASMGASGWDGRAGVVSSIVGYGDNHLPAVTWDETGNIVAFTYDGADQLLSITNGIFEWTALDHDENGNTIEIVRGPALREITQQTFDERDQMVGRQVKGQSSESFAYNGLGVLMVYTSRAGVTTQYLHDNFGRRAGKATPNGASATGALQLLVLRSEWDDNNRIVAEIDEADQRTACSFDHLDRQDQVIYPDGTSKSFGYDGMANIVRIVDQNGTVIEQRFDAIGGLLARTITPVAGGKPEAEAFRYDGLGRLVAGTTASGIHTERSYDSLSRLLKETSAGPMVRHDYDAGGNPTDLYYPGGENLRTYYDMLGRVMAVRDGNEALITDYTYGLRSKIDAQQLGAVLQATFSYTPYLEHSTQVVYQSLQGKRLDIDGSREQYDVDDNCTESTRQLFAGVWSIDDYTYDAANRLVEVQYNSHDQLNLIPGRIVQYTLTPTGTWKHRTVLDSTRHPLDRWDGVVNPRNAYLLLGPLSFAYDKNGNRILKTRTDKKGWVKVSYVYDYAGQLVHVDGVNASDQIEMTVDYAYDVFGRQTLKRIRDQNGTREYVRVWNGDQLIEEVEVSVNGQVATTLVYGAEAAQPVKMTRKTAAGPQDFYYTYDGRGFITTLVDQQSTVVERYGYDAIGQPSLIESDGKPVGAPGAFSPHGILLFVDGQLWDPDVVLLFGRGTAFDPETGQLLSPNGGSSVPGYGNDYAISKQETLYQASSTAGVAAMAWGVAGALLTVVAVVTVGPAALVIGVAAAVAFGAAALFGGIWAVGSAGTGPDATSGGTGGASGASPDSSGTAGGAGADGSPSDSIVPGDDKMPAVPGGYGDDVKTGRFFGPGIGGPQFRFVPNPSYPFPLHGPPGMGNDLPGRFGSPGHFDAGQRFIPSASYPFPLLGPPGTGNDLPGRFGSPGYFDTGMSFIPNPSYPFPLHGPPDMGNDLPGRFGLAGTFGGGGSGGGSGSLGGLLHAPDPGGSVVGGANPAGGLGLGGGLGYGGRGGGPIVLPWM